jgi:hypothetical protein
MKQPPKEETDFESLPGNEPGVYGSYVYIQRFNGETIDDLMSGILRAAAEVAGFKHGLGVSEAGAEIRLRTGEILEAVAFGGFDREQMLGAQRFAAQSRRLVAAFAGPGRLVLANGEPLSELGMACYKW